MSTVSHINDVLNGESYNTVDRLVNTLERLGLRTSPRGLDEKIREIASIERVVQGAER